MLSEFHSKYAILNQIGEGTFSEVLKCKKSSNGKNFAVKKLRKKFKHVSEIKDLPEMFAMETLPPHPNVLPMLEYIFDTHEKKLYMIFELMDMSVFELIQSRNRALPETRVKHMFYQILRGVDHLHSHGIFHRDIKPENILVKKCTVKLADLGSIRGTHSRQPYTEYISTRWYRAPETILTSGNYGPKMDIWACACVFYELLTSKPLFPGSNEIDQLTKIHQVVGTPAPRVVAKLRRRSKLGEVKFSPYPSINLAVILPFTSDGSRELMRRMLVYDPDTRISARRLIEHRYFGDLRAAETSHACTHQTRTEQNTGTKLLARSWAPSTKTYKPAVAESRSKPTIKRSPNKAKRKPKLKYSPTKRTNLTVSYIKTLGKIAEPTMLEQKLMVNIVGNFPNGNFDINKRDIKLTKSQIFGFKLNGTKNVLPPISELSELVSKNIK